MTRFDPDATAQASSMQAAAADPRSSAWAAANAGSGKTRLLTERVARLLLAGARPESVLCITFTKTAAGEMAGRLFDRLGRWAVSPDADLREDLKKLSGHSDLVLSDADLRSARTLFARALETPGGLKIQTIHAYCESVLRRFPLEAEAPPGFRTMEEAEADALRRNAAEAVLADAAHQEDAAIVAARTSDVVAAIARSATDVSDVCSEWGASDPEAVRAAGVAATDRQALVQLIDAMRDLGGESAKTAAAAGKFLEAGDATQGWRIWANRLLTDGRPKQPRSLRSKAAGAWACAFLEAEGQRLAQVEQSARRDAMRRDTAALLRLRAAVQVRYRRGKAARAALDYDDLIKRTAHLLERLDGHWVRWRLDEGVDHILVDEAQDTSPAQWAILQALSAEFFDGDARRPAGDRTILAVGDAKQSIFSFQGADPKAFFDEAARYRRRADAIGAKFVSAPLDVSFRSGAEILRVVDAVCALPEAAGALGVAEAASALERQAVSGAPEQKFQGAIAHIAARTDAAGRVELWDLVAEDPSEDPVPFRAPLDDPQRRPAAARLAQNVAAFVASERDRGAVCPRDVLILLRKRSLLNSLLVRALLHNGVPVAGADRLNIAAHPAAQDVRAIMRAALAPDDDLSVAEVLKGPLFNLSEQGLFQLAAGRRGSLIEMLRRLDDGDAPELHDHDRRRVDHCRQFLDAAHERARRDTPFGFLAWLFDVADPSARAALIGRFGHEADDVANEMLRAALRAEGSGDLHLQELDARWIAGADVKRELDAGRDEVRIMTVHGAKGLEAPLVILADAAAAPPRFRADLLATDDGPRWLGRESEDDSFAAAARQAAKAAERDEHIRLLYVAMTRAADRLVVAGHVGTRAKGEAHRDSWWAIIDRAIGDRLTDDGAGVRAIGVSPPSRPIAEAAPPPAPPPSWLHGAVPAEPRRRNPIIPSRIDVEDLAQGAPATASPSGQTRNDFWRRGRLIHELLERLPDIPADQRAAVGARRLLSVAPDLDLATRDAWLEEALAVLRNPDFADVFAPGSWAEVPIAARLDDGETRIVGRIDRMRVADEAVLAVDYKTNRPPPDDLSEADSYVAQMAAYRAALVCTYPGRPVRCALLWTFAPRLTPVPDALMDAVWARASV